MDKSRHPFVKNVYRAIRPIIPNIVDEIIQMRRTLGYFPNVWRPRTFNEKIAHRKLFGYDPRYAALTDKWGVRSFVRERIGEDYLTEVYQHVSNPVEIEQRELPESFVIKATHDCGSAVLVESKRAQDWDALVQFFTARLKAVHGVQDNQYWYSEISPALIVEERLRDRHYDVPLDYKLFVFHGVVQFIQVVHSRFDAQAQSFYDKSWSRLPVRRPKTLPGPLMEKPKQLDVMIEIAEALAADFDFVRVDLYAPNDEKVLFGELTFSPAAGRTPFIPRNFDFELGAYW